MSQRKTIVAPSILACDFSRLGAEVERVMAFYGVRRLIHGHTHRPAMHAVTLPEGRSGQRIVLGDWYDQGSVLRVDADGFVLSRPA